MTDWKALIWRAARGALAILAMYFLAGFGQMPVMLVPFATSIVLVLGTAGAVLLACFAFLWHNAQTKRTWPARWW